MTNQNLDQLCAQFGFEIAKQVYDAMKKAKVSENHITKSLGVLQEDGVYAFFLYQESRGKAEKPGAEQLKMKAAELLKQAGLSPFDRVSDPIEAVRGSKRAPGLADNLDELLLAKRLLEQALIYARYHAKALEG